MVVVRPPARIEPQASAGRGAGGGARNSAWQESGAVPDPEALAEALGRALLHLLGHGDHARAERREDLSRRHRATRMAFAAQVLADTVPPPPAPRLRPHPLAAYGAACYRSVQDSVSPPVDCRRNDLSS